MIVYSHNYVTLMDVCKHNGLDYSDVIEYVSQSDISFGTNEDTLMSRSQLQSIIDDNMENVELDWGRLDDSVLISLGG
jgi:hypothetical protein